MSEIAENGNGLEKAVYKSAAACEDHGPTIEKLEEEIGNLKDTLADTISDKDHIISDLEDTVNSLRDALNNIEDALRDVKKDR